MITGPKRILAATIRAVPPVFQTSVRLAHALFLVVALVPIAGSMQDAERQIERIVEIWTDWWAIFPLKRRTPHYDSE